MALWADEPIVLQEIYFDTTVHMHVRRRAALRECSRVGLWQIQAVPTGDFDNISLLIVNFARPAAVSSP